LSRDVRQAIAGCASLTSAFGRLRHHLLIGRPQPFAYAWAGSTLRFQAEMDLAQLVHQLGHMVGPPSLGSLARMPDYGITVQSSTVTVI